MTTTNQIHNAAALLGSLGGKAGTGESKARNSEAMRRAAWKRWSMAKRRPISERFWEKVKILGPNDCWLWKASKNSWGYGQFKYNNRMDRAHRVAWRLTNGEIPKDKLVLHRCDNPLCVNPNHLWLGTNLDNTRDCIKKGRFRDSVGEANTSAKLTEAQVKQIRKRHKEGETCRSMAPEFGVSRGCIEHACRGFTWGHI